MPVGLENLVRSGLVSSFRQPGIGRAVFAVFAAFFIVLACSHPDYRFVSESNVSHCGNRLLDEDQGESDLDCGGPDCHGCALGERCKEERDCAPPGACIAERCQVPGCENEAQDGEETGVDCGGGCEGCPFGQPCVLPTDCDSGVCDDTNHCAAPRCDDGVRNGGELDRDCGGSFCDGCPINSPCEVAADCKSALCLPDSKTCGINCLGSSRECDGNHEDPCETNVLTSADNCGECDHECEFPNATTMCVSGTCQINGCAEPWWQCNTDNLDGCETNLSNDPMNCGGCSMECAAVNGTPKCVDSECDIDCSPGFDNCDRLAGNGCETPLDDDVENCGGCDEVCPFDDGETPNCVDGRCGVTRCDDGLGDCDADGDCETDLTDDVDNCGRCGGPCVASRGSVACEDRRCVVVRCEDGWDNCNDGDPDGGFSDGCETNVAADPENCGTCGEDCGVVRGTGTCENARCAVVSCETGFFNCDQAASDGGFGNGCETDTRSDPNHCGGCGNACNIPNADAACVNSTCVIDDCDDGFDDCTDAPGCETNTSNSVLHCGSCAGTCLNSGATSVSCTNGRCDAPVCDNTHRSCDSRNENGCETDITTTANCGACGNACGGATPNCVPTNGTYRCQAQITLMNQPPYPVVQVSANSMSFAFTPHAGANRLIMLAIASESQGNGIAGARPDSVMFGNAAMTAGPEQVGTNDFWSTDHFVYYVNESVISSRTSQQTISINGATAPAISGMITQLVQLNGVRQTTPITAFAGGFLGTSSAEAPDPSIIGLTVPVAVSGSVIYSFASAMWMDGRNCPAGMVTSGCPTWSITPSTNLTLLNTVSTGAQSIGGTPVRAFGLYVNAASANLPVAGSYTPQWRIESSGRMTHLAVVVAPAQGP